MINKLTKKIGKIAGAEYAETPFIGAVVQEKISGVSFKDALQKVDKKSEIYQRLQENIRNLIRGLRAYHEQSDYAAFTWHGLGSDNVMCEVDESDKLTGRVTIVDANFTERPNKLYKDKVVKKMEKAILQKLEDYLDNGR